MKIVSLSAVLNRLLRTYLYNIHIILLGYILCIVVHLKIFKAVITIDIKFKEISYFLLHTSMFHLCKNIIHIK